MKNKSFIVLALFLFFSSCKQNGQIVEYYSDGSIKSKVLDEGNHKVWFSYYQSGGLKSKGMLLDSIRNGTWYYYTEDGRTKATGSYSNGLKEGIWTYHIDSTFFNLDWRIYVDSSYKINIPNSWLVSEHVSEPILMAAYRDSTKLGANFNIAVLQRENSDLGKIVDQILIKNSTLEKAKVLFVTDVTVNNLNGKEVTQEVASQGRSWFLVQYFLEHGPTIYLLSYFIESDQIADYKETIKEIAYSFTLIPE